MELLIYRILLRKTTIIFPDRKRKVKYDLKYKFRIYEEQDAPLLFGLQVAIIKLELNPINPARHKAHGKSREPVY